MELNVFSQHFFFSKLGDAKGKLWKNAMGAQGMFRRKNTSWSFPQGLDEGHPDMVLFQQF